MHKSLRFIIGEKMPRYCIICGREETSEKALVNGLCTECFLKHRGILKSIPVYDITICSVCGSWRYHGRWHPPLPVEDIIKKMIHDGYEKIVNKGVELIEVEDIQRIYKVNKGFYEALVNVTAVLSNNDIVRSTIKIRFRLNKVVCPLCSRKAGKSFNALVQIRSERGYLTGLEKEYIYRVLTDPGLSNDVVEIKDGKHGIDIKMLTPVIARKLASTISREHGAKVIETFKLRKYDPRTGRKNGVTTLSVRLPDLSEGDIVSYNGELGIIRNIEHSRVRVHFFSGKTSSISINDYWRGSLSRVNAVEDKEYLVIAHDSTTLYLLDEKTGEIKEYPRQTNLNMVKDGDRVKGYRVKDRLYMVKVEGDNHGEEEKA